MTLERFIALPALEDETIEVTQDMSLDEIKREITANETVGATVDNEIASHIEALAASQALKTKLLKRRQILNEAHQTIEGDLT